MSDKNQNRVIVCGGGLSGLAAAVTALENGAQVMLIEKAPELGGNAAISNGVIWSFSDFDRIRAEIPDGDPVLQWLVHDSIDAAWAWLESQGATLSPKITNSELGRNERTMAPPQAIAALADKFRRLGGEMRLQAGLDSLITQDGVIRGVRITHDGRTQDGAARAVVIATGGFQGNTELLARYVVRDPDNLYLRGNPWQTGDGFLAATQIGAAASPGLDTFYGHALTAPPARISKQAFRDYTQWYGQQSIAVNLHGERFADESHGSSEHALNQALAQQPRGMGFYIVDQELMDAPAVKGKEQLTRVIFERARAAKAPIAVADNIEELCRQLGAFGVPENRLFHEITQFNRLIESGHAGNLKPPRKRNRKSLSRAPFYAVGVKASITFTMGGLLIDERARVLRRAGTTSPLAPLPETRPSMATDAATIAIGADYRQSAIEGLYAAGCDAGNICHFGYMGGLGPALVTGWTAGKSVAGFVKGVAGK